MNATLRNWFASDTGKSIYISMACNTEQHGASVNDENALISQQDTLL